MFGSGRARLHRRRYQQQNENHHYANQPRARVYKELFGNAPRWSKIAIVLFLLINPVIFYVDPFLAGWLLVVEFIFTLAMALKCYPLQPGGTWRSKPCSSA